MKELAVQDLDIKVQYHLQELPNYGDASIHVLSHYQTRYPGCVEIRKSLQKYRHHLHSKLKRIFAQILSTPTAKVSQVLILKRNLPMYLNCMQWFFDYQEAKTTWSHHCLWEQLEKEKCYETESFFLSRFQDAHLDTPELLFRRAKLKLLQGQYDEANSLAKRLSEKESYAYEARKIIRQAAIGSSLDEEKSKQKS